MQILQDLRFAIRTLLKTPGFVVVSVITLALGIGANTAIFSVVNSVLLRPLPYKDPDRLVVFRSIKMQTGEDFGVSPADFIDWRQQSRSFEQLSLYTFGPFSFRDVAHPESVPGARVSTDFFQTLGIEPYLGRTFSAEEGRANGPRAVILSYKLWQRRFGGDPTVVGKTVEAYNPLAANSGDQSAKTVDTGTTIIGVMPAKFEFPPWVELWTPLATDGGEMEYRASRYMQVVGRLKPGKTLDSAQAEMKTIAGRLEQQYPKDDQGWTTRLLSLRDHLIRDTRVPLLILLGAVGFVLLIACANVANLLLVRATSRQKEIAVRLALGAGRWRIIRELLCESVLLTFIGGALGLVFASWGIDVFVALLPKFGSYRAPGEIRIEPLVLLFTFLNCGLTALVFGIVPAWQASQPRPSQWLMAGKSVGSDGGRTPRLRSALAVVEISLAMVLLVGAGLLLNSFVRLRSVNLGYQSSGLFSMQVAAPMDKYHDAESRARFYQQMAAEVARVPNVQGVTLTSTVPFGYIGFPFNIEGHPLPNGDANTRYSAVGANYLKVIGARLSQGREFDDHDDLKSPPVALINQAMARQYFAGANPLGQKIVLNYLNRKVVREIVGVVSDIHQDEIETPTKPEVLVPFAQQPWFSQYLVIRVNEANLAAVRKAAQQAIWSVDSNQATAEGRTMDDQLSEMVAEPRLYTILLGTFAALALTLAMIGIYGVMAYAVANRTHEIGIRMALGAQAYNVLSMVLRRGIILSVTGVVIGIAGALALTRVLSKLLFGVAPTDAMTFMTVSGGLILIALLACYIPARRATKVDPVVALRYE